MSIEKPDHQKIIKKEQMLPHSGHTDEKKFQWYQRTLKLTPEDIEKKILDVGSGSAKFAKYVREHIKNAQIFSTDLKVNEFADKQNVVKGNVEALPFKSDEFELVISVASIPNMLRGSLYEDKNSTKFRIKQALQELLRVTKPGGEIRLGPVVRKSFRLDSEKAGFYEDYVNILNEIFTELQQSEGIKIQEKYLDDDYYYDSTGLVRLSKSGEYYLIIISKPNKK